MAILLQWSETIAVGATIKLDNGDVVYVSIAGARVLVRQWDLSGLLSTLMSRFLGRKLYDERNAFRNASTAEALWFMYPNEAPELPRFANPLLAAFANAVWHCRSAAEAEAMLNDAAAEAQRR